MNSYIHMICGMKLLTHSQTSTVQPLEFGNDYDYLAMLGLKLIHVSNAQVGKKILGKFD